MEPSRTRLTNSTSAVQRRTLAVNGADLRLDATAHVEVADDFRPPGPGGGHEVVEDAIGDVLVEGALLPERPQVELERFQLDEVLVGHVADANGGEVRLPRHRAQAGELRDRHGDLVVAVRMRVGHHLEPLRGLRRHTGDYTG